MKNFSAHLYLKKICLALLNVKYFCRFLSFDELIPDNLVDVFICSKFPLTVP